MNKDNLRELVKPYNNNLKHPYYRPYVTHNENEKYNIFLAGINPATPIYTKDIDLNQYADLLTNYDEFYKFYNKIRQENNTNKISRTSLGITSFVDEIERSTGESVLETNVVPYPTKNKKILAKVDPDAVAQGLSLFYEVLIHHSPQFIIIYSKGGLEYLVKVLYEKNLIENKPSTKMKVAEMENSNGPFLEFKYPNGKRGVVFVCRHFMYYGREGKSYSAFKNKVILSINEEKIN